MTYILEKIMGVVGVGVVGGRRVMEGFSMVQEAAIHV